MKKAQGKSNLSIVEYYLQGNRPFVQVGYDPNLENSKRKEGEEWEDSNGKKWIWKNGSKRRISKHASLIIEQRCKSCNADVRFGNYLDDQVWPKTHLCYDCFIKNETELKLLGVYEDFDRLRDINNEISILKDQLQKFNEAEKWCIENTGKRVEFVKEDASIEVWEGLQDYDKLLNGIRDAIKNTESKLLKHQTEQQTLENKIESAKSKRHNKK